MNISDEGTSGSMVIRARTRPTVRLAVAVSLLATLGLALGFVAQWLGPTPEALSAVIIELPLPKSGDLAELRDARGVAVWLVRREDGSYLPLGAQISHPIACEVRLELAADTPSPAGVPATAPGWFREDCLGSTYLLDGTRVSGIAPHRLFRIGVRAVDANSITIDLRDLRFDCVNGAPERGECSAIGPPRRRRPLSQGPSSGSRETAALINARLSSAVV